MNSASNALRDYIAMHCIAKGKNDFHMLVGDAALNHMDYHSALHGSSLEPCIQFLNLVGKCYT